MKIILSLIVAFAGALTAIQVGMNAQLRQSFGHGLLGAATNFTVGTALLWLVVLALRLPLPTLAQASSVPLWAWLGGACGAFIVTTNTVAGRELGALAIAVLTLSGGLIMSVLLDHFGWFGFPVKPFTLAKLAGCVLLVISFLLLRES